jgi:hypothetical protein
MKNTVIEGIRKHGLARNFYLELKARIAAGGGLTAREWDWYKARQKEWEPDEVNPPVRSPQDTAP